MSTLVFFQPFDRILVWSLSAAVELITLVTTPLERKLFAHDFKTCHPSTLCFRGTLLWNFSLCTEGQQPCCDQSSLHLIHVIEGFFPVFSCHHCLRGALKAARRLRRSVYSYLHVDKEERDFPFPLGRHELVWRSSKAQSYSYTYDYIAYTWQTVRWSCMWLIERKQCAYENLTFQRKGII